MREQREQLERAREAEAKRMKRERLLLEQRKKQLDVLPDKK